MLRASVLSLILFSVMLTGAASAAATGFALTCADLGRSTTLASLKTRFGADNVVSTTEPGPENIGTVDLIVIYPKDFTRQLVFFTGRAGIYRLAVGHSPEQTSAPWTIAGIHLGSTLAEVEALNGEPFRINGFDFDGGGSVTDWMDGKLAHRPDPCTLWVRFAATPGLAPEAREEVTGDQGHFTSSSPVMRAVKPIVTMVGLERK